VKKSIINFLIACSGADKGVLDEAGLETPRFVSIGAAILLTAVLASLSGGYALYSSFNSVVIAVIFGVIWAVVIFNLDRYIVVSIDKNDSALRQTVMAIPRLLISFLLAITITKPLELRIFQGSINNKLYEIDSAELLRYDSTVSAKKKSLKKEFIKTEQQKTDIILADYTGSKEALLKQQGSLLKNITFYERDTVRKKILLGRLRIINRQLAFTDSSINNRKKQIYSGIIETETLNAEVKRRVYKELFATDSVNILQVQEIKDKQTNRDMLVRLKALSELKASDDTMNMTGNLITLLFILIEMSPVLIKLMSKKGLYEAVMLTKHNELYLKQESKKELLTLTSDSEKKITEMKLVASKSMNVYIVKKHSLLSKKITDKWYNDELSAFKKKKN
jgi:hypothetical protein